MDDFRDIFQPLPAYPIAGGVTGPSGFAPGGRWAELMPLPQPLPAYPAGPPPMLPNPDGDGSGGGNGNTSAEASYHNSMEKAAGGSFARRDQGTSHGNPGGREVLDSIHDKPGNGNPPPDDDPENPDYDQFGLKQKLQMLENQVRVAEESGDLVGAAIYQAQIDATKAWVDANGTPADVAGEGIEDAIAIGVALLPDPVGDAAGAAVAAKLTGKAMGYAGKVLGLSDEVFDGLNEAKASTLFKNREFGNASSVAKIDDYPGTKTQVLHRTSDGSRVVDRETPNLIIEDKTGYVPASEKHQIQALKDKKIMDNEGFIANWVFQRGRTGKIGPSKNMQKILDDLGIKTETIK